MFDVARIAGDPRPILKHLPANPTLRFICEPQFGSPVHTDDMRPLFLTRIYRFHDSVQIGTQKTLYFITGFLLLYYHLAASTVPWHIILRQPMLDVTPIAALMDGAQTQLANNNLVALRIVLFKANITDDVLFNQVLVTLYDCVRVCVLHHFLLSLFLNFWFLSLPDYSLHEFCFGQHTDLINF